MERGKKKQKKARAPSKAEKKVQKSRDELAAYLSRDSSSDEEQ